MRGSIGIWLAAFGTVMAVKGATPLEPLGPVNVTVPAVVKDNPPIKFNGDGWGIADPGTFGCSGPFDPSTSAVGTGNLAFNTSTPGESAALSFQGTAIYANLFGEVLITVTLDGTVHDDIDISGQTCNQTMFGFNATSLSATSTHTIQLTYKRRKFSPASGAPASFYVYSFVYTAASGESVSTTSGAPTTSVSQSSTVTGTAPSSTSTKPSTASRPGLSNFGWITITGMLVAVAFFEGLL